MSTPWFRSTIFFLIFQLVSYMGRKISSTFWASTMGQNLSMDRSEGESQDQLISTCRLCGGGYGGTPQPKLVLRDQVTGPSICLSEGKTDVGLTRHPAWNKRCSMHNIEKVGMIGSGKARPCWVLTPAETGTTGQSPSGSNRIIDHLQTVEGAHRSRTSNANLTVEIFQQNVPDSRNKDLSYLHSYTKGGRSVPPSSVKGPLFASNLRLLGVPKIAFWISLPS